MLERGNVRADNEEGGGEEHCAGNGLDRGRVDVVVNGVDMPARDVPRFQVLLLLLKVTPRWNTISGI